MDAVAFGELANRTSSALAASAFARRLVLATRADLMDAVALGALALRTLLASTALASASRTASESNAVPMDAVDRAVPAKPSTSATALSCVNAFRNA